MWLICQSTLYYNNVYHFYGLPSVSGLAKGNALLHRGSSSMKMASLGLFWPAHPLQIVSCISLSLVFKHRQVVCPCGSRPQVSLSSSSELRCSVFCVLRYVRLSCRGEIGKMLCFLSSLWCVKYVHILMGEFLFGFVSIIPSLHCCRWLFGDTRWEPPLRITDPCQTA